MRKGFTLIEILVVISIIGVLLGVGAVSFSSAQKKARDSARKTDLRGIKNAMEQYYSLCNGNYPVAAAGNTVPVIATTPTQCNGNTSVIMATVPTDPKTGGPYVYFTTNNPLAWTPAYSVCTWSTSGLEAEPTGYCVRLEQ